MSALLLPRMSGWAIPDDGLTFLAGMVEAHKPKLIVEAGSGRSTIVLADALRANGSGLLVALEHEHELWHEYGTTLSANDLDGFAEIRYAPIERGWYARAAWDDLHGIDILLVDGPPGHLAPFARAPAMRLLHERLAPKAVVVVDDTNRQDENLTLNLWRDYGLGEWTRVPHSTGELAYAAMP